MSDETTPREATQVARRGFILILSSPSGAGKTTLTRALWERTDLDLTASVSVTTRARRPSELSGRDYDFIDRETFIDLRDRGDLLEWAEVHGNFYGTPRRPVEKVLASGRAMIFDIDYQGTRQVREAIGQDVVTVFILPPSMAELKNRLERRAEDSRETIERRLANSLVEIERWVEYDYVLVNDDIDVSFGQLTSILAAERLRRDRQVGLPDFVSTLIRPTID